MVTVSYCSIHKDECHNSMSLQNPPDVLTSADTICPDFMPRVCGVSGDGYFEERKLNGLTLGRFLAPCIFCFPVSGDVGLLSKMRSLKGS
jgi:hypothetical protein